MKFVKGQSGNPGGKPKQIKGLLEKYGHDAEKLRPHLFRLAVSARDESVRLGAIKEVNDRALGKPAVQLGVSGHVEHNFVLRDPGRCETSEEWERLYGPPSLELEVTRSEAVSDPPKGQAFDNIEEFAPAKGPNPETTPAKPFPLPGEFRRPASDLASFHDFVLSGQPKGDSEEGLRDAARPVGEPAPDGAPGQPPRAQHAPAARADGQNKSPQKSGTPVASPPHPDLAKFPTFGDDDA